MTETFNENVLIDGSDDVTQLRVQGHSTQNESLQTWENSASDVLAQVTSDGRLQFGDDLGFASPDALIEAHRAETSTAKPKRGFHAHGRVSDALNNITQWIVQELEVRGTGSISAIQTALRVGASNKNTGTPAGGEVRAADLEVIHEPASAATLPRATGLRVGVTNTSGNTIQEAKGLHVAIVNQGTITNPYAIFTEGAGVTHLDDYLEMKRPAATPGTPSTDYVRVYAKSDGKLYAKNWSGAETQLGGTDFTSQTANTVFAGPTSGGAAAPTFRALVANDVPALDASKIATGVLDNARINWAAPDNIGTMTPASIKATALHLAPSSGGTNLVIDAAAGNWRAIIFRSGTSSRWVIGVNNLTDATGNVGSDFNIFRYDNTGASLGIALGITRADGNATFYSQVVAINPNSISSTTALKIGSGRTGDGYAHIDLSGDTTYSDYGLRILRDNTGANANSTISHRGTGNLILQTVEASNIIFKRGVSEVFSIGYGGSSMGHYFGDFRVTGNVGIQVAPGSWALRIGSDSAAKPNGGMWSNSSDQRMKRNIEPYTTGLDFLQQLPEPVRYEYNGKGGTPEGLPGTGFIAQELQKVAPSWVQSVKGKLSPEDEEENDLLYVNNSDMIFVLMNSVRELADRLETLEVHHE